MVEYASLPHLLLLAQEGVDRDVHIGPGPLDLVLRAEDLVTTGLRGHDVSTAPADRALIRAATGTDAELVVLPQSLLPNRIPVTALLRFARTPAADLGRPDPTTGG